ncbi:flagellar assembly protein FliH [Oceanidesulfovibrio indonesiensis]|uniref:Flagellar assembly protein FliH n=1 Tax=Oceanidesulfovibrio indonesiensis TaxID=54767 RepID=A0A7M3MAD7_9BACT|nr:FliH/SctL family protein [Oceanidesulfovibrio indonesiensis]TVM14598.1 flagellar assembly protein FliH [Oceanidesulfovibrio indonesiensis]
MSSSNASADQNARTGKVIMGGVVRNLAGAPESPEQRQRSIWDEAAEAEYLTRVKARAADKAREVLLAAREEAAELRRQAADEGYEEGVRQAQDELVQAHQEMAESLASSLAAVSEGSIAIWRAYREELVLLVQLAVEKIIGITLDASRREVIQALLDEAAARLEASQGLVLRVHPEDKETLESILEAFADRYHTLRNWRVEGDGSMTPGGLKVESSLGMVDNSLQSRRQVVQDVLDSLELPETEAERQAREEVEARAAESAAQAAAEQAPVEDATLENGEAAAQEPASGQEDDA